MKDLLKQDSNGFNKYHGKIVYDKSDVAELDSMLNSKALDEAGNSDIFLIFSTKASHQKVALNIVKMAFLLQGIDNIKFLKAICNSTSFKSLLSEQKVELVKDGLIKYFDTIFEYLDSESLKSLIFIKYQFGGNLLDHLIHLQGDYKDKIAKVIEKIGEYSEEEIMSILAPQGGKNLIQTLIVLEGNHVDNLSAVLQSKMFKSLSSENKAWLLTEGGDVSALMQASFIDDYFSILKQNMGAEVFDIAFQNKEFTKLYLEQSMNKQESFNLALNNLSAQGFKSLIFTKYQFGGNLLDHLIHLQGDYKDKIAKVIEKIGEYSEEEIMSILAPQGGKNLIQTLIVLEGNYVDNLSAVLQSKMFKSLSSENKAWLLTEGGDVSALMQASFKDDLKHFKVLLETKDEGIIKQIIGNIQYTSSKKLPSIIQLFSKLNYLKDKVDYDGFSILYYLKQKDIDISALTNFGFEEIVPNYVKIDYHDNHEYYYFRKNTKTAVVFIGQDDNGANDVPGTHTFLKKGYNVINIDARKKSLTPSDVYKILKNYDSQEISLFVIESHGGESSIEQGRHTMPISGNRIERKENNAEGVITHYSDDVIYTVDFLKELSATIGNKAISVFLTSCKGQIAVDEFKNVLPVGSEILTVSEYQTLFNQKQDINTIDANIRSLYQKLQNDQNLNSNNIDLKLLSILYSGSIKTESGSPYYLKISPNGNHHDFSCITATDNIDTSKIAGRKADFIKHFKNQIDASIHFESYTLDPTLNSAKNLVDMRNKENVDFEDYGMKLAVNCWIGSMNEQINEGNENQKDDLQ